MELTKEQLTEIAQKTSPETYQAITEQIRLTNEKLNSISLSNKELDEKLIQSTKNYNEANEKIAKLVSNSLAFEKDTSEQTPKELTASISDNITSKFKDIFKEAK
jgi:phage terminase Nu1 subunit (DNA packaging protein)